MKFISSNFKYIASALVTAAIGITATAAFAQDGEKSRGFCANNNWSSNDRVSFSELREMTISSSGSVAVDAGKNGGVSVSGEDRGDIVVRACIQAWGNSGDSAKATAAGVSINTSGTIKAENPADDKNWSVSYHVAVPRSTNLKLTAYNGGISIADVDGSAEFETRNGGVSLKNLSGDVKGRTDNGGVNVSLAGSSWRGNGLDVETKNGGVNLTLSKNYAARIETGTVNGGFKSDIPELNVTTEDVKGGWRNRSTRINTSLNGGGAPIRVITTNGGIKINALDNE